MNGTTSRFVVLLLALAVLAIWVVTFRPSHDWGGDFSLYIAHARNLAEGRPYGEVHYLPDPFDPLFPPHSPPTYPPVFPILLAPAYALYGLNYVPMKAEVQVLWLVSGILFYLLARRYGLPPGVAGGTIAVFLLSSMTLELKDSVVSESTYLVISALALLLGDFVYRQRELTRYQSIWTGVLMGFLLAAAYQTRVAGLTLAMAFGVVELVRERRIRLFAISTGAVFIGLYVLYRLTLYDGQGYGNQFRFTPGVWMFNFQQYLKSPAALWASAPAPLRYAASTLVLLLCGLGYWLQLRRKLSLGEVYTALYMVPLIVYSSGSSTRYILPIYPLVLIYCAVALLWLISRLEASQQRLAWGAVALALAAGAALNVRALVRSPWPDGPESADFQKTVEWIRTHTGSQDVVVSWNPRVVALYTDRPSSIYLRTEDPARLQSFLQDIHADWLVSFNRSERDVRWLIPYLPRFTGFLEPAVQNGDFVVYRVGSEAAAGHRTAKDRPTSLPE